MKLRKILRTGTTALAALLALAIPAQAASFPAIVTSGSMKVYADANLSWQIGALPATTVVTVESFSDGRALISMGGNRGYASISDMASIESLASRVVFNTASRVYQSPSLNSRWLSVPAGMELNLLATCGQWAMVENAGIVAYTNKAHLSSKESAVQPSPTPETQPSDPIITETFAAEVVSASMRVYQSASTSSQCLGALPKGVRVTVHAYTAGWAYIELNGNYGFAQIGDMNRVSGESAGDESDGNASADEDYMHNDSLSVEQIIYLFLTREMKLNTAVACGILANVERECSFKVTNASHDGGYGICQWTGVRNTRLKNWCKSNGYDYATLEGQLWYLKYELENYHPKTLKYLKTVENTPAGAYDAAYYFCYNFEVPANRASRSVERGNIAKDKYWQKYAV